VHEGVLAEAAPLLDRQDLLDVARQSAHALLVPQIELAFPERTVQPYGVAAAVYALDRLYQTTGESAYARWRDHARAWFDGRNALFAYPRAFHRGSSGCVFTSRSVARATRVWSPSSSATRNENSCHANAVAAA